MSEEINGGTPNHNGEKSEIFSKSVRAGKRTYFFDVKSTRGNDFYLTITESKKRFGEDGKFHYEKHKIFLYKEDFEKFMEGLNESVGYIKREKPEEKVAVASNGHGTIDDIKFEDLGSH